jgi:hypothetical protein
MQEEVKLKWGPQEFVGRGGCEEVRWRVGRTYDVGARICLAVKMLASAGIAIEPVGCGPGC